MSQSSDWFLEHDHEFTALKRPPQSQISVLQSGFKMQETHLHQLRDDVTMMSYKHGPKSLRLSSDTLQRKLTSALLYLSDECVAKVDDD